MDRLRALRLAPLQVRLQTLGEFRSPEFKGALFRGGFGKFFREQECTTHMQECAGCLRSKECAYSQVFETPADPGASPILRRGTHLPHPFVLCPPLDNSTWHPPGSTMQVNLTVLGGALSLLPKFARALDAMGRAANFGGKFRVIAVESALAPGELVYDGTRTVARARVWEPEAADEVTSARLEFVSPLRLRVNGQYSLNPGFTFIVQTLLRRIHLLSTIHGGANGDSGWLRPLYECADKIRVRRVNFVPRRLERFSGRQQHLIPMHGVVGSVEIEGRLAPLVPFLQVGEWLHVGSGTALGLGKYIANFGRRAAAAGATET